MSSGNSDSNSDSYEWNMWDAIADIDQKIKEAKGYSIKIWELK